MCLLLWEERENQWTWGLSTIVCPAVNADDVTGTRRARPKRRLVKECKRACDRNDEVKAPTLPQATEDETLKGPRGEWLMWRRSSIPASSPHSGLMRGQSATVTMGDPMRYRSISAFHFVRITQATKMTCLEVLHPRSYCTTLP